MGTQDEGLALEMGVRVTTTPVLPTGVQGAEVVEPIRSTGKTVGQVARELSPALGLAAFEGTLCTATPGQCCGGESWPPCRASGWTATTGRPRPGLRTAVFDFIEVFSTASVATPPSTTTPCRPRAPASITSTRRIANVSTKAGQLQVQQDARAQPEGTAKVTRMW